MALTSRYLKVGELLTVLNDLWRGRDTGTLVLQREAITKFLYFQDGQVIFAASNAPEDKFTQILMDSGRLSPDQVNLATEKRENRTLGRALVDLGFISSEDLLEALIAQVKKIALSVAEWPSGTSSFKPNVLPPGVAKLPITTEGLVLDTALGMRDRAWVGQALGGMESVFKVSPSEQVAALQMPLPPEGKRLVDAADGRRSVREICEGEGLDLFMGAKFFLGLFYLQLAHRKEVLTPQVTEADRVDLSFLDEVVPAPAKSRPAPDPPPPEPLPLASAPPPTYEPAPLPFSLPPEPEKPFGAGTLDDIDDLPQAAEAPPQGEIPRVVFPEAGPLPPSADLFPAGVMPTAGPLLSPAPAERDSSGPAEAEPEILLHPMRDTSGSLPPHRWRQWSVKVILVTLALVAVAAMGLWWFKFREDLESTTPSPAVKEQPAKSPTPRPQAANAPVPGGAQNAPILPPPPGLAPANTPVVAPPPVPGAKNSPAPAPPPVLAIKNAPVAALPPVAAAKNTPAPLPPPPVPGGKASDLLAAGKYPEAARAFQKQILVSRAAFTIDVEIACQPETVAKGFAAAGGNPAFMILPYGFRGRSCYRVIWGTFGSRAEAEAALKGLPGHFTADANPPKIRPLAEVKAGK